MTLHSMRAITAAHLLTFAVTKMFVSKNTKYLAESVANFNPFTCAMVHIVVIFKMNITQNIWRFDPTSRQDKTADIGQLY